MKLIYVIRFKTGVTVVNITEPPFSGRREAMETEASVISFITRSAETCLIREPIAIDVIVFEITVIEDKI